MINQMKKLSLIVLASDAERVMNSLAFLSCAEIEKTDAVHGSLHVPDMAEKRRETEQGLDALRFAIPYLSPDRKDKRGFLSGERTSLRRSDVESLPENARRALDGAYRAQQIEKELLSLGEERRRQSERIRSASPWLGLDVALGFEGTEHTSAVFGTLPASEGEACRRLSEMGAFSEIVCRETSTLSLFVLYAKRDEGEVMAVLSAAGFAKLRFAKGTGTAAQEIENARLAIAQLDQREKLLLDEKKALAQRCADMETVYDILDTRLGILEQREKTAGTEHTVLIRGWIPAKQEKRLMTALAGHICSCELSDPEEGDDVPVQLHNPALADPFEALIGLYSYPKYGSFDPTLIAGIFFSIFFGLMTADVGYGFLITAGCLILLKRMKPRIGLARFLKMFAICGVFSMTAGVLFNGWFGDLPAQFAEKILGVDDFGGMWYLIDPISDPITFFILSLVMGAVHLICGMVIKMGMLIRSGDVFSAVFDVGSWLVVFLGIALYAFVGTAGGIVALAGVLMVVLTHGRRQKNIVMKFFSGLLGLYDIVSYMSDLLSYSRVLALGLSSAVIASVFNVLATLGGSSAVSLVLFPLVFVLGHALNIALSLLGSFIHSSRLQYVEFFGKFYEDGGRPFSPMAPRLTYTELSSEEPESQNSV